MIIIMELFMFRGKIKNQGNRGQLNWNGSSCKLSRQMQMSVVGSKCTEEHQASQVLEVVYSITK